MLMGKQMVLTVLIVAVAFGTESKFQLGIGLIRPAADGAFMLCHHMCPVYLAFKLMLPFYLFRTPYNAFPVSKEKYNKIEQGR